jgi:anti-anti-sigma regulatory factor
MPTALECHVERRVQHTLVRLVGALDQPGTAQARSGLLKTLAEQPDSIVIDLSGVTSCHQRAHSVFHAFAGNAARWPAIPVVLCAPSPAAAAMLVRGRALLASVPICATLDEAVALVAAEPPTPAVYDDLLPVAGAARRARELVTEACVRWDLPELVGPACIVLSELVNNAVEHAGTMLRVRIALRRRHLHLAVSDGSSAPPVLGRASPNGGGRGLRLVDTVAGSWGHLVTVDGKVVWATLPRGDQPALSDDLP